MILAGLSVQNVMTGMWQSPRNLAKIVRWQFGREYDGSEVRHRMVVSLAADFIHTPALCQPIFMRIFKYFC